MEKRKTQKSKRACPSSCNPKALNTVENIVIAHCISELN